MSTNEINWNKWTLTLVLLIALAISGYKLVNYIYRSIGHEVSFGNCTIKYHYRMDSPDMDGEENRAANGRLALCLCKIYRQKPDTTTARKILELYDNSGHRGLFNTSHNRKYNKLDSVIKYRKMVFDTLALYD